MVRRILLRVGDFVFVTRPLILIPVWSFFLLGTRAGRRAPASHPGDGADVFGFVCLTAIMVTAYLINQVFDLESDRRNNKGHYLTRGIMGVRTVVAMALVSFAVASVTFQDTSAPQRVPLVAALVLSLVYSLPPIRLCARPFLDLVANAIGYGGIAYLVGYLAWGAPTSRAFAHALPYVLLVGATFLHTTILDIDGDRASGKITSSVAIGARASAWLALALCATGLAWALVLQNKNGDILPVVLVGVSLPLFAAALVVPRGAGRRDRVSSYTVQSTTLVVTVAAGVVEPRYLVLVVPLVIASRYYYRARFGVSYPGIAGDR